MTRHTGIPWFYNQTRSARKIIVVDLGFLGDSVHLTPSLVEIKRHYPEAELHVVAAPSGAALLEMAPNVDRVWAFPLGPKSPPWYRHWNIIGALRRERFDLAINFSGSDRTVFITALTGAKWRVACQGARKHFWGPWLIKSWVPPVQDVMPVYEGRRQFLASLGFTLAPARFDVKVPDAAQALARSLTPGPSVHFSINASGPLAEWPVESWAALAKTLRQRRPDLAMVATATGAPRERERLGRFQTLAGLTGIIARADLRVPELAAVIERSVLHVGADSGALHLAAAMGTPSVSFFRVTASDDPAHPRGLAHVERWRPRGDRHVQRVARCRCVDLKEPACGDRPACLAEISVESTLESCLGLLSSKKE
jgi:ADP-heptose:LPS heptosyltransferase